MNVGFVIAFEKNAFFGPFVCQQKIQYFSRGGSPVDIVTKENNDRAIGWIQSAVHVDLSKQGFQKIRAAMNIPDRVNSEPLRQSSGSLVVLSGKYNTWS